MRRSAMPWWAWVLIAIGAVGIGYLKITVLNRIVARRRTAAEPEPEE
jgi:hypothetical protein